MPRVAIPAADKSLDARVRSLAFDAWESPALSAFTVTIVLKVRAALG
jgi:hypothetical protein